MDGGDYQPLRSGFKCQREKNAGIEGGEGAANWWENGGLVGTASAEKNSPILWVGVPRMESKHDVITLSVCFSVISLKERTSRSRFKRGQREQREHRMRQSSSSYGMEVELIVSFLSLPER